MSDVMTERWERLAGITSSDPGFKLAERRGFGEAYLILDQVSGDVSGLSEGWFKDLMSTKGGNFMSAFGETIKMQFAGWILKKLGLDSRGYLFMLVRNVVGELSFSDLKLVLSGDVKKLTPILNDAIAGSIQATLDKLLSKLGVDPGGAFYMIVKERASDEFIHAIADQITPIVVSVIGKEAGALSKLIKGVRLRSTGPGDVQQVAAS